MHSNVSQRQRFYFGLSPPGVLHTAVSRLLWEPGRIRCRLSKAEVKVLSQPLVCLMGQSDRFNGWSRASVLNCLFVSGKVTALQKEERRN